MARLLLVLMFTLLLYGCETQTTVVNNVFEREANEIVVLLQSRGVNAIKAPAPVSTTGGGSKEKMYDITVPSDQITDALAILNQTGLPRVKGTSLLDLFGSQGLVPSDLQDQIRYQEGLSEQIASTIRKMDGIIDANVQITFPRGEEDEEEKKQLTASVYVKHRGVLDNPNSLMITKIKRLVASAIPGLSIDDVSVVADRAIYADISLDSDEIDHPKEYVSIWKVVVANESAWLFRLYFYTFIILIFLLACLVAWISWKFFPLLQKAGFNSLAQPEPYTLKDFEKEESEEEEVSEGEES